jgi:hypothetical protein
MEPVVFTIPADSFDNLMKLMSAYDALRTTSCANTGYIECKWGSVKWSDGRIIEFNVKIGYIQ